jgi:hypothetical protein
MCPSEGQESIPLTHQTELFSPRPQLPLKNGNSQMKCLNRIVRQILPHSISSTVFSKKSGKVIHKLSWTRFLHANLLSLAFLSAQPGQVKRRTAKGLWMYVWNHPSICILQNEICFYVKVVYRLETQQKQELLPQKEFPHWFEAIWFVVSFVSCFPEAVFLDFKGVQELIPRNRFLQPM